MNGLHLDNSMDALNLYSGRYAGGAVKNYIDISGWTPIANSVYYLDEKGNRRTLPKYTLQDKIAKEAKAAAKAAEKAAAKVKRTVKKKSRKASKKASKKDDVTELLSEVSRQRRLKKQEEADRKLLEKVAAFRQRGVAKRGLKRSAIGLKASLARARGRISATQAAQKKAARKRAAENRKLERLIALQEEVEQEFPDVRSDSDRWAVELSHKVHPKSKTTLLGRDYWREEGYKGCAADITDERYAYLCDKLNKPKPRKRAAAGLSGASADMANLPEYRRAINSLRN